MNACVECFSHFISPSLSLLRTLEESVAWYISCCSLLQTLRESVAWNLSCCSLLRTLRKSAAWKFTGCSSVQGGDPAQGWIWDRSGFAVLFYGWEELILQVSFRHDLQVGDSNLPFTCLCFYY